MAFLTWLPEVLREAGVRVRVLDGALKRSTNTSGLTVQGIVWHDTVTPASWTDAENQRLLRDGHSNLKGPLSQVGISREGYWDIIALGKCNHNGYGTWGNDSLGLEFYNGGADRKERFTTAQIESGVLGTAAVLRHLKMDASRVMGHKETDPRRKIDPWSCDMTDIRRRVKARLSTPAPKEGDDMVQDIIGFHTAYFGLVPGSDKWNKDIVKSVNWHLWRLTTGQAHLEQIRQDFAKTVGL